MWWQVIPPSAIIVGLYMVHTIAIPVSSIQLALQSRGSYKVIFTNLILEQINFFVHTGRPCFRRLTEGTYIAEPQRRAFMRDYGKFGNEYVSVGLDNLSDDF